MLSDESVERSPEKISELQVKCPICGGNAKLVDFRYGIPYYGDVLISVLECSECGYVHRDVFTLTGKGPRKIVYRVEKPGDENALVIKSSYCTLEIPELGLKVEPGAYSQGYITTVEGVILNFIDVLEMLCGEGDVPREKCAEVRTLLEKARNVEIQYTIILFDYIGASDVISEKTKYEELREEHF